MDDRYNEIYLRLEGHMNDAIKLVDEDHLVGIFLCGSQNYNLDTPQSDVDTKAIILPSFSDFAFAAEPRSWTHIRENDEHIELKDLRSMFHIIRKQNINFVEILFTNYFYVNPDYAKEWKRLLQIRERIARYNPWLAIKTMQGCAHEKWSKMQKVTPAQKAAIDTFGYDPKQLHHILRLEEFMERYLNGVDYARCLLSEKVEYLTKIKSGWFKAEDAMEIGKRSLAKIDDMVYGASKDVLNHNDDGVVAIMNEIQYNILKKVITKELTKKENTNVFEK